MSVKNINLINIIIVLFVLIAIMLFVTPMFIYFLIDQRAKCAEKYGNDYSYSLDLQKCINFKGVSKQP